jgi:hypothetical protein
LHLLHLQHLLLLVRWHLPAWAGNVRRRSLLLWLQLLLLILRR